MNVVPKAKTLEMSTKNNVLCCQTKKAAHPSCSLIPILPGAADAAPKAMMVVPMVSGMYILSLNFKSQFQSMSVALKVQTMET